MQRVIAEISGRYEILEIPDPQIDVWPGLRWGRFDQPLTPAFWASQAWMAQPENDESYRLGGSLIEEAVFCILGGYGAPAEVGLAASRRICLAIADAGDRVPTNAELEALLLEPLVIGGKKVRYRFARQRARFLTDALARLRDVDDDQLTDIELRQTLCQISGVGPKTGSWIVRNRRGSDQVAILDVHIVRACQIMEVFSADASVARDYFKLERRFLAFCRATRSRASAMDAIMWATMRSVSHGFLRQLIDGLSVTVQYPDRFAEQIIFEENHSCPDRAADAAIPLEAAQ